MKANAATTTPNAESSNENNSKTVQPSSATQQIQNKPALQQPQPVQTTQIDQVL